jgi:hypothetical protein
MSEAPKKCMNLNVSHPYGFPWFVTGIVLHSSIIINGSMTYEIESKNTVEMYYVGK